MGESIILGREQIFEKNSGGRNNNVLTIASSGGGKTYSVFQPNIMELRESNAVIMDPKGYLHELNKAFLEAKGYKVQMIDFDSLKGGVSHDPLSACACEEDVMEAIHAFVFAEPDKRAADPYWDKMAELALLAMALLSLSVSKGNYFLKMLQYANEFGEDGSELLDEIFKDPRMKAQNPLACESYKKVMDVKRSGADKTYGCIISTMHSIIFNYATKEFREFLELPKFEFESLVGQKTVLFVKISDTSPLRYPYVSVFITQLFRYLYARADMNKDRRLDRDVVFFLDDFASTLRIESFGRFISTGRSRGISFFVNIQDEPQLKAFYKDEANTIIGNCDNIVLLGTTDLETAEHFSQRTNRPVYDILSMPIGSICVLRRGEKPVFTRRYNYKSDHKDYLKMCSEMPKSKGIIFPNRKKERA